MALTLGCKGKVIGDGNIHKDHQDYLFCNFLFVFRGAQERNSIVFEAQS